MRCLIVLRNVPYPPNAGGKLRAAHLANYLAERHDVSVVCFTQEGESYELDADVRARFREFRVVPLSDPGGSPIRRWLSPHPGDVQRLHTVEMKACVEALIAKHDPEVLIAGDPSLSIYLAAHRSRVRVLDYVCVTTLQFKRLADISSGTAQLLWKLRERKYGSFHRRIAGQYDLCLVNSKEDRDALLETSPGWRGVEVVPNGLELVQYPLGLAPVEPGLMVYAGSVTYGPNRDAVQYFVDAILPRIHREVPDARLLVTGATPKDGSAPEGPHVDYTGYLDDVRPVLGKAWTSVVPLRAGGGGVRFKVLESMALGSPMVSTAIGAEGVAYVDRENILMAERPEQFAARTVEILKSPELRAKISSGGRKLIEEQYDWRKLGAEIESMLEELVARKRISVA